MSPQGGGRGYPVPDLITDWSQVPVMVPFTLSARVIGVSRSTLYNLIKRGDLHAKRVGTGRVFIPKAELRRYCEAEATIEAAVT
jgi:excisionase family DNA binding protein